MFRVYESRENIPTSDVADSLITGSRLDQEVQWCSGLVSMSHRLTSVVTSVVTMYAAGVRGGGHPPGAGRQPRHGAAAAARHRGLGRGRLQENQGAGLEEQVSI